MKLPGMSEKERRAHSKSAEESMGGEYNPGEVSVQSERDKDDSSF